jgi:hypothetical protein
MEGKVTSARNRWSWVAVAIAGVAAAASIVFFWLNRPEWGYCVDGEDFGYCDQGVFSSNAIIATVLLGGGMLGLVVTTVVARGSWRSRAVAVGLVLFAVLLVVAWVLQFVSLEATPIPHLS